jgi:hypothetical protein
MSDINASELNELADQINQIEEQPSALLGFDGFVDLIIHLVDERRTVDDYIRLDDMTKFADLIHEASGKSANVEMVPVRKKLGGNGPIMGQALLDGGASVSYIGALGKGRVHPVFEEFAERCDYLASLADPGHTEALEFKDGKLMLGKYQSLKDVSWKRLIDKVGQDQLDELLRSTDLVACLNWTMVQYMNGILSGLKPRFDALDQEPLLFIDLADPRKRTIEDQETMLDLISEFDECATVILGLNEEESRQIAEVLGLDPDVDHPARARNIRSELELSRVVVHPVDSASVATPDEVYSVQGPYTESPQLTTGAGDNFNAGYCLGELYGFPPRKCLQMGVHTSGFYVREAESPSPDQIASFMRERAQSATTT